MKIFEYPYVIITCLIFGFMILGAFGIYFAVKGYKTANGKADIDFSNVNKLENRFEALKKARINRCLVYVNIVLDSVISRHSEHKAQHIFAEIKPVLLKIFADGEKSNITRYEQHNFIALNEWSTDEAAANIEQCQAEINKCLLKHEAVGIVDIRFGSYCSNVTQITFDEAVGRAKQACMLAQNGNIAYAAWTADNGKALEKKIKIENSIEDEIDNNRFFLDYQPVLDARTKKIVGAEVLSRLNSKSNGILTPGTFLSAVDSVGLNSKFDYYIFEKNCKWISNNKNQREQYSYSINLSRETLCDPLLAERVIGIADKYSLKYSALAIEVLEDKNIDGEAKKQMMHNLSILRQKGFAILLDDFGSGFTTFSDLHNFDITTVKIDKSITQKATTETGFLILKNVIRTAKELGLHTLCEGVETEEYAQAAISAGCDMLQGYYYYKPIPVAKLEKLLEENA